MDVPLVDLSIQHREIAAEITDGFAGVFERTAFILGPEVERFERAYADWNHIAHCIGVSSGTDAIELSLRALDIGPGDEVILPANTFIATALAVVRTGATPVLVDGEPDHLLVDVDQALAAITDRTKAMIPVHLYGQMAPIEVLTPTAAERGVALVEDAAQAHGATRHGRSPGSATAAAATSFYPGKNLGAYGDAGAVLTVGDDLARQVRALRNWGSEIKYYHPEIGFNARLDTLQAVVLLAKLGRLDEWNRERRRAAARYTELLADLEGVRLPSVAEGNVHVWHLYVVRVHDRDRVLEALNAEGVGAGIHYPIPIHRQPPFEKLGAPGAFPVAERAADEILSLPLFPGITEEQLDHVAGVLRKAVMS